MKRQCLLFILAFAAMFINVEAQQQTEYAPKYEAGIHFTALNFTEGGGNNGVGGRFAFNLNRHVALEAEGNFFPARVSSVTSADARAQGRGTQALFGVKAGKRYEKAGFFAKVRPGFTSFSNVRSG
jgi:hypothetical protein